MNRKGIVTAFLLAAGLLAGREVRAQRTYEEMEQLTVNERVTTVVTASEPVRLVDISNALRNTGVFIFCTHLF